MKKILKSHMFSILVGLAIVFGVVIIGLYGWGISYLISAINQLNNNKPTGNAAAQFNIAGAAQLNYRGILSQATTTLQP
jgi:hypothetical protein